MNKKMPAHPPNDLPAGIQCLHTLQGHKGTIYSLNWSPDGEKIATGATDNTIHIWDVLTGQPIQTIRHDHAISLVIWSPDGRFLASGVWDRAIQMWDARTGKLSGEFDHDGVVSSLAWSPDGRFLATGTNDKKVSIWEVLACTQRHILTGHTDGVISLAWSPDGTLLASGSDDCTVRLWEPHTANLCGTFKGHQGEVISLLWSPDSTHLCTGAIDEVVHLWNVQSGDLRWKLEGFYGNSDTMDWSPDGQHLALGAWDETIHLVHPETGEQINLLHGHTDRILGIRFSPDGRLIVSKCRDHTLRFWQRDSGQLVASFQEIDTPIFGGLAFHPQQPLLATRGGDGDLVHLWQLEIDTLAPATSTAEADEEFIEITDSSDFTTHSEPEAPPVAVQIMPKAIPEGLELLRTFSGHTGVIGDAVWSPDGLLLASGAADHKIYLWERETGERLKEIEGHKDLIDSLAWSPDGRILASASADHTICLWESATGALLQTLKGHYDGVTSVSWAPNAPILASSSRDKSIRLWDTETGELLITLEHHKGPVYSVAWSPNGRMFASASFDQTICIWDGRNADLIRSIESHGGAVTTLAWAPDSNVIASGCADNTIHFWSVLTGQPLTTLKGHTDSILCVRYSPDGRLLASKSYDSTVRFWRSDTGALLAILIEPAAMMDFSGIAFHPTLPMLLTRGESDLSIRLWKFDESVLVPDLKDTVRSVRKPQTGEHDVETAEQESHFLSKEKFPPGMELLHLFRETEDVVTEIDWSPDGNVLIAASADHLIRLWDTQSGKSLGALAGHTDWVSSVAWSPDGQVIGSGAFDRTVRLWDVASGEQIRVLEGHRNDVSRVAWSPDSQILASGSRDQTIRLWNRATGDILRSFEGHRGPIYDLAWFPDGNILVSASFDKTLRLWDVAEGAARLVLRGHSGPVTCVAVSPDGLTLASGSHDNTIRFWHAETGRLISILETHTDTVLDVGFSPDGLLLASKSYDNTVRLWRCDSGDQIAILTETSDMLNLAGLAFHPTLPLLATRGEEDRIIRLWRLDYTVLLSPEMLSTSTLTALPTKAEAITVKEPSVPQPLETPEAPAEQAPILDEAAPQGITILKKFAIDQEALLSVLAWSPVDHVLAVGARDGVIYLWHGDDVSSPQTLTGHTDAITSLCWSPDGQTLASGSADRTIRFWDVETGEVTHVFEGHNDGVLSIAWAPDGWLLASGSDDQTLRLWDSQTGDLLWTFAGHGAAVSNVAWAPDSEKLVSVSFDNSIRIWDAQRGQPLRTIEAQIGAISSVAWSPDGQTIATGLFDHTIRLWQADSGQQLTILEGHTDIVVDVEYSPDGRMLLSKSDDATVRFWRGDGGQPLAILDEPTDVMNFGGLAFHPTENILATRGEGDRVVRIWQFDTDMLLQAVSQTEAHYYRNAKVVLVGDSGMGKSGLSLVLTGQPWEPTASTHGRHVWIFESHETVLPSGQRETRETLLWDLAGQPDYRLIHQLYLNEVVVALLVFDASSTIEAFAGVRHWSRALHQAHRLQSNATLPLKKFLVAARCDRSGLQISRERIDAILKKFEFDGFFETSAKEGWQIPELITAIREGIDWDTLPKVSSSELFQIIKQFLVDQKRAGNVLSSSNDLYRIFYDEHPEFAQDAHLRSKFDTCVSRVENRDLIRRLSFGGYVLLQPELLDAYASALINAARSQPDGLGFIVEEEALNGTFKMSQDERVADPEQEKLLLIATVEELLRHELILKEATTGVTHFVFPSQITREVSEDFELPEATVRLTFEGPLLNIYATLTIRLAQSGLFTKKDRWKNVATYTSSEGGLCGIVLSEMDEGQGELALFFDGTLEEKTRYQFEDYVTAHLKRLALPNTVQRQQVIACTSCGEQIPDSMVKRLRERGRASLPCPVCEHTIPLLGREDQPIAVDTHTIAKMDQTADAQRERDTAAMILKGKIKAGDFDVFLCHNSKDKAVVKAIGEQLKERGLLPWLDEWEFRPGFPWQKTLETQLDKIKSAAVFIGSQGIGPWQDMEIDAFLRKFVSRRCPVIPVILEGCEGLPKLPVFLEGMMWVDFRKKDPDPMEQLLWGITGEKKLL